MPTANKHWFSDLWKNKFVKVPVIIIIWAILGLVLFLVGKIIFGYNVKIGSFESNPHKPDTVRIIEKQITPAKQDSPISFVSPKAPPVNVPVIIKQITPTRKDTTPTIVGKNINTGTNNGIIGDNAVINTPLQVHPDKSHVEGMAKYVKSKTDSIQLYYNLSSKRSQVFVEEFIEMLKSDGYIKVVEIIDLANGLKAPKGIHLMKDKGDNVLRFFITVED